MRSTPGHRFRSLPRPQVLDQAGYALQGKNTLAYFAGSLHGGKDSFIAFPLFYRPWLMSVETKIKFYH